MNGPDRVPLSEWSPLGGAPEVDAATRALRDRLLGTGWDDPTEVHLSWVGVSSFIASVGGHVVLFDAWEIIGAVEDYVPVGREELAAIMPEAVFVGHGHFDHAGDLGYVAGLAGSVVVGSDEICTVAEEGAIREGVGVDFRCLVTGTATAPAPGTAQSVTIWSDLAPVTILQHLHSNPGQPNDDNPVDPQAPVMDVQPYLDHFATNPDELARFLAQQKESNQGGTWLHHFVVGDFTLLWGNSSGPISTNDAVKTALDSFPGCVDVMTNAILGFDQPVSGLNDPKLYVEHAHPKVFLPQHADAWAPVISAGQAQYEDLLAEQIALLENPPHVDFLLDPSDYVVPRIYDTEDPRWATPMAGSSCAAAAAAAETTPEPEPEPTPAPALPTTGGGLAAVGLLALAGRRFVRRRG